jgi:hypothetical protein
MSYYKIILDEQKLDDFITWLPQNQDDEVYYICLFGRHKYCAEFPNTKDSGQLARIIARKHEIKEKIRRLEAPIGSYSRDGIVAPQECLAMYIGLNPRSLPKANKQLLMELAKRIVDGDINFSPISSATTEIHRAMGTKYFVDFDFDIQYSYKIEDYTLIFDEVLYKGCYRILQTKGGFHLIVDLQLAKNAIRQNWYKELTNIANCDVKGTDCLTPIPGCTQGNFCPYFV